MRVVSWNVNGIRACVRHGFVDFVDRSGADIVGVQEVRARPEDIPPAARRSLGWHTAFTVAERRGYSGVGLYSKLQPVRVDTSLGVPRGVVARIVTGPHDAHRQDPPGSSPVEAIRHGSAEGGHPIEDRTAEDDRTPLPGWAPGPEPISDNGLVSEERVLHPALTMVP